MGEDIQNSLDCANRGIEKSSMLMTFIKKRQLIEEQYATSLSILLFLVCVLLIHTHTQHTTRKTVQIGQCQTGQTGRVFMFWRERRV